MEEASDAGSKSRRFDGKTLAPAAAILALILVPILVWAATSGGSDRELRVESGVSIAGGPEIVVSVPRGLNRPDETAGKSNVVLTCVDGSGMTVLREDEDWPFIEEPGYDLPHIHQAVSPKQLQSIGRCRLAGTKTKLEGDLRRK